MASTLSSTRLPAWLLGSGVIAVAMGITNVSTYAFTILAARLLGPREYGALAALMGLLLVINVISLGLQATGARRVAARPESLEEIESEVLSVSRRAAAAVGVLTLLLVPVVTTTLRLDGWFTAALLAATSVPLTLMGGQAGILQGERRWLPLAGIYLAVGLGRIVLGGVALLVAPSPRGAMIGVTLGAVVPVVLGWFALRHTRRTTGRARRAARRSRLSRGRTRLQSPWMPGGVLREMTHNSHALLAFFALSNADVVIARTVLDDEASGLYAGGLILAKAVLFLPQFVVVVAFPSMSEESSTAQRRRRRTHLQSFVLVLAIGLVATGGAWLLSDLAVMFVGGAAYAGLTGIIWAFAAVGTILALLQLLVYNVVARQSPRAVLVIWAGLLALLAAVPWVESGAALLTVVAAVEGSVLLVLLVLSLRRPAPRPVDLPR